MTRIPRIPMPGAVLAGKYVLRERIGEGGMGVVFCADDPALDRTVAIKVLHPRMLETEWGARRFYEEAMAARRVKHPGAVSVIECELTGDTPFIVMQHVPGCSLGRLLEGGPLPVARALAIADQILDVLDAAHAAGVVHADLKSENVLAEQRGDRDVVTIVDFGLARVDGAWSEGDIVSGTPEYMAPELIHGDPPTPASDLYGVAVILYELLTGATPFAGGSSPEIFARHLHARPTPPSARRRTHDVTAGLDEIVLRALAKDPGARFASARDFQLALRVEAIRTPCACGRCARCRSREAPATYGAATHAPRRAIAGALIAGDVTAIASGYLALAQALARDHRLADAIRELEEGLDVLATGPAGGTRESHQLLVALAALSRRAGRPLRRRHGQGMDDAQDTLPYAVRHAPAAAGSR